MAVLGLLMVVTGPGTALAAPDTLVVDPAAGDAAVSGGFVRFISGPWGSTSCATGSSGGFEFRWAVEFSLEKLPADATVTQATLSVRTSRPDFGPVEVYGYAGDGEITPADVEVTGVPVTHTPVTPTRESVDVSDLFSTAMVEAGWAGFSLRSSGIRQDWECVGDAFPPVLTLTITPAQAVPTITTQAPATATVGQPISDVATLAGGASPTGAITFQLFGPDDAVCAGAPVFTSTTAVDGNGEYTSDAFTPAAVGTYRWVAAYGGDAGNAAVATACGDANEITEVVQAVPAITTQAPATATVGQPISDVATLAGGASPTGAITFQLFGPDDAVCAGAPVFTSTTAVDGNGQYSSDAFTPTVPGTYRWVAAYGGDAGNAAVTTACGDANEITQVQAVPTINTQAPATATVGQPISDVATLAGGASPTGAITFQLFGPDDAVCAGPPVFASTTAVDGNGEYTSDAFIPTAVGTYRWVAAYGGDANNAAVTTACGEDDGITQVAEVADLVVSPPTTMGPAFTPSNLARPPGGVLPRTGATGRTLVMLGGLLLAVGRVVLVGQRRLLVGSKM